MNSCLSAPVTVQVRYCCPAVSSVVQVLFRVGLGRLLQENCDSFHIPECGDAFFLFFLTILLAE